MADSDVIAKGFGVKTPEELQARDGDNKPPEEKPTDTKVENPEASAPVETKTEKPTETPPETKPEETAKPWWEEVNKQYKTEFKSGDDFKSYFEKAVKYDETEAKARDFDSKEKQYKEQIESLQGSLNPLNYFSSPEAYVAEQLRKQHPDKSPYVLQEVVTGDITGMSDLDVLIKNTLLETPDLEGGEAGARELVYANLGIDPETPKEEWTSLTRNKIKTEAKSVRKSWNELKSAVEIPTVVKPEDVTAQREQAIKEKEIALQPELEKFSKFDEFTVQIDENTQFKYSPSDGYKEQLPDMFKAYFLDTGNEFNAENIQDMVELKEALMLRREFPQIYKIIVADVETRMRAEEDQRNGNTKPENANTAPDTEEQNRKKFSDEHGFGKMFR